MKPNLHYTLLGLEKHGVKYLKNTKKKRMTFILIGELQE